MLYYNQNLESVAKELLVNAPAFQLKIRTEKDASLCDEGGQVTCCLPTNRD